MIIDITFVENPCSGASGQMSEISHFVALFIFVYWTFIQVRPLVGFLCLIAQKMQSAELHKNVPFGS